MRHERLPVILGLLGVGFLSWGTEPLRADSTVVFNEIMYHPRTDEPELEWLELHNQMAVDMDVSNWSLADGIDFRFPEGTVVRGGGFLVVAISPRALETESGHAGALGPYTGRLENSGERLELRDNNFRLMDSVRYRDRGRWPVAPDGSGLALAKRDPASASAPAANWTSSREPGGTPGAHNFPDPDPGGEPEDTTLAGLAFNETRIAPGESWVELTNGGAGTASLEGLLLHSTRDRGIDFPLPSGTLDPGSYLVLGPEELGFDLSRNDKLFLYGPEQREVLAAAVLEDGLRGRYPDGTGPWLFPDRPTPGEANSVDLRDDVVINEILYHQRPVLARPGVFEDVTILPIDASWSFDQSGRDLGASWREGDFDDRDWPRGRALFFNETSSLPAEKNTPLELGPITYYFRTEFEYPEGVEGVRLALRPVIDDGAVFYLNGVEVHRFQMPEGEITASTLASRSAGNARFEGPFPIPAESLVRGRNVLAVEVHQSTGRSNDVVFGVELLEVETVVPPIEYEELLEEWVELYNRSDRRVDLSGWSFQNGIRYTFAEGTTLERGGYLVLAGDATSLRAKHPGIAIAGDFDRRLSNRSDRLLLVDARGNPVDEVRYHDRGRWHEVADGLGSSLELRDPQSDNAVAEAWAPSDESGKSSWKSYSYTARATPDFGPTRWNELVFGFYERGEVLLDDMSVIESPGSDAPVEFLQNGDFEEGDHSWRFLGTHDRTRVITDPDDPENRVLHLVATDSTEHMHNHVETTFGGGRRVRNGLEYRVSFRAKWLSGSNQLHTRLYFNRLARMNVLDVPYRAGTPGARNSRFEENIGPTYSDFGHAPVFPAAGEEATVTVRAEDPDGVKGSTLFWSEDRVQWESVPMSAIGQGLYRGALPSPRAGVVATFYVEGEDALGARSTFPARGPGGGAHLTSRDAGAPVDEVHTLRILMARDIADFLYETTNRMSNDHLPATLVVDEREVFYDVGVRLRGSERGRPDDTRTSFHIRFQPDKLFRGVHRSVSVDRSGGWVGFLPRGAQDEIVIKHIANHAGGIPSMYDDIVHVIAPRRVHTSRALLLMARFSSVYLDSQFGEEEGDGSLYTYELIYYPQTTTDGHPESLKRPLPDNVQGVDHRDLGDDKELYRWFYLLENNLQRDDYGSLMRFTKSLGLTGAALDAATRESMDIDQWLRAFAMYSLCGVGDTYMSGNLHNNIYYARPSDGKVMVFPWDMDFAFVNSASHPIVWNQHNFARVLRIPRNTRRYYRHLLDIMDTTFNRDYLTPWVRHYGEVDRVNFSGILSYVAQRESFVRRGIPPEVPFAIITNGGEDFTVEDPSVEVEGTGWIDIASMVLLEHPEQEIEWRSVTRWRVSVDLEPGENSLSFLAFGEEGDILGRVSIGVTRDVPGETFIRGDVDLDGRLSVTDAVRVLLHLFAGEPLPCEDAADVDDDESLSAVDALTLLRFLYRGGAPPAPPFPESGPDPDGEEPLSCERGLEP